MSQHRIYKDNLMAIIGYDKPLNGFFLIIEDESDEKNPVELFNNLKQAISHPSDPETFFDVMKEHGFDVNNDIRQALSLDQTFGVMNEICFWEHVDGKLQRKKN